VLFIDEIHRLNPVVEEYLYPAMEDFALDILLDRGPSARSVRLALPRFTLVGATTRAGLITSPLRTRFGLTLKARLLRRGGPDPHRAPLGRAPGRGHRRGGRARAWRGARGARRASPTGCCAACAISPR